jgi:hypothetical protein
MHHPLCAAPTRLAQGRLTPPGRRPASTTPPASILATTKAARKIISLLLDPKLMRPVRAVVGVVTEVRLDLLIPFSRDLASGSDA